MTSAGAVAFRHTRGRVTSFSYQSHMPAGAGTRRYEKLELWLVTANWQRGFCHARPPPQRGTSSRTTFPSPPPLWIPAFAGMTDGTPERRVREPWNAGTPEAA